MTSSRRAFLRRGAGGIVLAATLGSLDAFALACRTDPARRRSAGPIAGYGPLRAARDQADRTILALPEGFRYVTFGLTGSPMSDGNATPRAHDGMGCFALPDGRVRLIRNHEVTNRPGNPRYAVGGPAETRYDPTAGAGCVTVDFDVANFRPLRDFVSLNGTLINCAGGLASCDSGWLTCEETVFGPPQGFAKRHGYVFHVGRDWEAPKLAEPLRAMGRFLHEAAVATEDGTVYETEDDGDASGFYRFLPVEPRDLSRGGKLQMLAVRGQGNYDTRFDQKANTALPVEWVTIDDPDPEQPDAETRCFAQGYMKGGARFNRLEGLFRGEDGSVYFTSTSGGNARYGQLWQYRPRGGEGELILRFESPEGSQLDSPDNLCITPSGALLFCEDDATRDNDRHALAPGLVEVNRLVGLTRRGETFEFTANIFNETELAGACFSPDGTVLFVNLYGGAADGSGMTCAITGPWERGPL